MELYEKDNTSQDAFFPIQDRGIFEFRKKLVNSFWTADEVITKDNVLQDQKHWKQCDEKIRNFVKYILAFFAIGDGVVVDLINSEITTRIKHNDWIHFEAMKVANESIHSETYSQLIDIYITNRQERDNLLRAVGKYKVIHKKIEWVKKWVKRGKPLCYTLFAMIVMESIFFSGAFRGIFWLREIGLFPALSKANEYIARDEGVHGDAYIYIYNTLIKKISPNEAYAMMTEAVDIADMVVGDMIPDMLGMNSQLMTQHIKFNADNVLSQLGYAKIWKCKDPFLSGETIVMHQEDDFFLKKSSNYNLESGIDVDQIDLDLI
jgi:ribonucleotide reductase beta subunit family protein with ferritin-like domain